MQANRLVMQGASKAATTTVRAAAAVRVSQPTTIDVQAQPKPAVVFEPTHELQKIPTSVSALQETPLVENTAMNTCVTLAREPEIEWVAHKKVLPDLKHILSDCPDFGSLLTVQTWQTTEHSMVSWKRAVEKEREQKTAKVIQNLLLVTTSLLSGLLLSALPSRMKVFGLTSLTPLLAWP